MNIPEPQQSPAVRCSENHAHDACAVFLPLPCGHHSSYPYRFLSHLPKMPVFSHKCSACGEWRIFGVADKGFRILTGGPFTEEEAHTIMHLLKGREIGLHPSFCAKVVPDGEFLQEHVRRVTLGAPSMEM